MLMDTRCHLFAHDYVAHFRHGVSEYVVAENTNFLMPNLLEHFDFNHISDPESLRFYVFFLAF